MKRPLPYRWNPQDHPELRPMTPAQKGCYRDLVDQCWIEGSIPKDPIRLAALCGFSPAENFAKEIWTAIKDNFSPAPDGGYRYSGFDGQIKASKKLSKLNSERAISMWRKRKDAMLAASQNYTETAPERPNEQLIVNQEVPAECERHIELEPKISPNFLDDRAAIIGQTAGMPPGNRKDIESEPSQFNSEAQNFNNDPVIEPKLNTDDFDRESAWKQISSAYPEMNLYHMKEARELFEQEIISKNLQRRIFRAVARYRQATHGKEALRFADWFHFWQKWEDGDNSQKTQKVEAKK